MYGCCLALQECELMGLKNLDITCYMNCIIQCLSHTSALSDFLLKENFLKSISLKTKGRIVRPLAELFKLLWSGHCDVISAKDLKKAAERQELRFTRLEHQNAQEFLILMIDWFHTELQTTRNYQPESIFSKLQHYYVTFSASQMAWRAYWKASESFILQQFYEQVKSTAKCTVCGSESSTYDPFSNFSTCILTASE